MLQAFTIWERNSGIVDYLCREERDPFISIFNFSGTVSDEWTESITPKLFCER
jgi:hypothetical protein